MKLTHEVVTSVGFKEGALKRPNEKFYSLDHKGLIILLSHYFLGKPGLADLWALEKQPVETVADMLVVMHQIGQKESNNVS